jgi:hypothetical protein
MAGSPYAVDIEITGEEGERRDGPSAHLWIAREGDAWRRKFHKAVKPIDGTAAFPSRSTGK